MTEPHHSSSGQQPGEATTTEEPIHSDWPLKLLAMRTTVLLVLLTVIYYLLPLLSGTGADVVLPIGGTAVSGALALLVIRAMYSARRRLPRVAAAVELLLTVLYVLILVFSSIYYVLGVTTDQFAGLKTKTDALYFTVTVVTTVGFGDIHATQTAGRALVTAQMLFDLLYIGTAFRLLSRGRLPTRVATNRNAPSDQ